jgi:hypothetical protein
MTRSHDLYFTVCASIPLKTVRVPFAHKRLGSRAISTMRTGSGILLIRMIATRHAATPSLALVSLAGADRAVVCDKSFNHSSALPTYQAAISMRCVSRLASAKFAFFARLCSTRGTADR